MDFNEGAVIEASNPYEGNPEFNLPPKASPELKKLHESMMNQYKTFSHASTNLGQSLPDDGESHIDLEKLDHSLIQFDQELAKINQAENAFLEQKFWESEAQWDSLASGPESHEPATLQIVSQ